MSDQLSLPLQNNQVCDRDVQIHTCIWSDKSDMQKDMVSYEMPLSHKKMHSYKKWIMSKL